MTTSIPLSILDLAPITEGSTASEALTNSIDLAQHAERLGYRRFWVAEHHFTPGVASSAPAVLIGQIAAATSTIRVGSAAVQTGHQTPVAIVEQFGILDALYSGRIDLGLGRSGQRLAEAVAAVAATSTEATSRAATASEAASSPATVTPPPRQRVDARVVDGLLVPKPFSYAALVGNSKFEFIQGLLQQRGAQTPDYGEQVAEIFNLVNGLIRSPNGDAVSIVPGEGAGFEVWIFGSSAGQSAEVAGARGLPFAANYHVSPSSVLEAVEAYRSAFRPSSVLAEPYVVVSADVVVAEDDATARELARPYAAWVRSVRSGEGAIRYPDPSTVDYSDWTEQDHELVADRVDTQFVGTAEAVADSLATLAAVTGANEVLVTTITHRHQDRVRSHELLANEWFARGSELRRSDLAAIGGVR